MDDIILRSLQGQVTPAEDQQLRLWRERSLSNERHYREIVRVWDLAGEEEPGSYLTAPAAEDLLRAGRRSRQVPRRQAWSEGWRGMTVAASIIFGLVVGFQYLFRTFEDPGFGAAEFVTGPGEMVTARLNDGTVVKLAPESRLRARGTSRTREVWLDGRAFFAVAHDENRPFTVRTRAGDAQVLGTRFDVMLEDTDLRVVVVEGKVAVAAGEEVVEVEAGQLAQVVEGNPAAVSTVTDMEPYTAWLGNFVVFQSTPLSAVAAEIEQRYGVTVQISDPALAEETVTAWFSEEGMQEILSVVCRVVDAHCSVRGAVVSIEP